MINSTDPLQKLVVNVEELDKERLASLIDGYIGVSKDGRLVTLTKFIHLSISSKIIAVLLSKKASFLLGFSKTDSLPPKEIEKIVLIPGGTVRRELLELKNLRLIEGTNSLYSVPNHAIPSIALEEKIKKIQSFFSGRKNSKNTTSYKKQTISQNLTKLLEVDLESIDKKIRGLMLSSGQHLERSLAVLKIARDNGIDGLTAKEITSFLKEKIRAGSVYRENISLALGKGTKYLDRIPDKLSGGYIYKIMISGEEYLNEKINKTESSDNKT